MLPSTVSICAKTMLWALAVFQRNSGTVSLKCLLPGEHKGTKGLVLGYNKHSQRCFIIQKTLEHLSPHVNLALKRKDYPEDSVESDKKNVIKLQSKKVKQNVIYPTLKQIGRIKKKKKIAKHCQKSRALQPYFIQIFFRLTLSHEFLKENM